MNPESTADGGVVTEGPVRGDLTPFENARFGLGSREDGIAILRPVQKAGSKHWLWRSCRLANFPSHLYSSSPQMSREHALKELAGVADVGSKVWETLHTVCRSRWCLKQ